MKKYIIACAIVIALPEWVTRDKSLAQSKGADPLRWWGHVEQYSARAKWAFAENRDYPRRIIYTHQPRYRSWCAVFSSSQGQKNNFN